MILPNSPTSNNVTDSYLMSNSLSDQSSEVTNLYHPQSPPPSPIPYTKINHITPTVISKLKKLEQSTLKNLNFKTYFFNPVDPIGLDIPDYFEIIKNPICFKEITQSLNDNVYKVLNDYTDDINLMFSNSFLYNKNDPYFMDLAKLLYQEFISQFNLLFPDVYFYNLLMDEKRVKKREIRLSKFKNSDDEIDIDEKKWSLAKNKKRKYSKGKSMNINAAFKFENKKIKVNIEKATIKKTFLEKNKEIAKNSTIEEIPNAKVCHFCSTADTPMWRRGENNVILCNKCGVRWRSGKLGKLKKNVSKIETKMKNIKMNNSMDHSKPDNSIEKYENSSQNKEKLEKNLKRGEIKLKNNQNAVLNPFVETIIFNAQEEASSIDEMKKLQLLPQQFNISDLSFNPIPFDSIATKNTSNFSSFPDGDGISNSNVCGPYNFFVATPQVLPLLNINSLDINYNFSDIYNFGADLTIEEKLILSTKINLILKNKNEHKLEGIIKILKNNSASLNKKDDELIFDLNQLNSKTCFELKSFVESFDLEETNDEQVAVSCSDDEISGCESDY
ncbi:hypothetical protein HK099_007077 [Clydaea vesicula]|uniref:GATA-type domain-containing protein n=1 Tax=Clydaea vesicula TaxID=447962 RepID=A0AAD5U5N4_9FUNG|nr:hypothetical protein HK099_007077 [Clydaea vesicula]